MSSSQRPQRQASSVIRSLALSKKRRWSLATASSRRRSFSLNLDLLEARTLLSGQTVQLIKDVNAVASYPSDLTVAGPNLFFLVEDSTDSGQELEVLGASGSPLPLMDFPSSSTNASGTPFDLTAVGSDVYFLTYNGSNTTSSSSNTLWVSDGTVAGTEQIAIPNTNSDNIDSLTALGNTLIFATSSYNSGEDYQLWAVPSPTATPTMIVDLGDSNVGAIDTVGSSLYLSVGGNLWTTDGTTPNTKAVTDSSGSPIASPTSVFGFNNETYAFSESNGQTTIGVLGTSALTPIVTIASETTAPVVVGSKFYFAAGASSADGTQLWVSDGTVAGTRMLDDFSSITKTSRPTDLTNADGSFFFTVAGSDGLNELWTSTGTSQGTVLVKDLGISPSFAQYSGYSYYGTNSTTSGAIAAVGGTLFFTADDGTHGAELWSDNVATGTTQMVDDIDAGPAGSDPREFVDFNGSLYFSALDGSTPQKNQLWMSNGTSQGTTLVASFTPAVTASGSALGGSGSSDFGSLGSELFVPMDDGVHGTELWLTDGTAAGTTALAPLDPYAFASLNGTEYFLADNSASTRGLWKTDGTAAGTTEVKDLSVAAAYGDGELVASNGMLFFTTDGVGGEELWTSNGTQNGTVVVKDFATPSNGSRYDEVAVSNLTPFGGKLAFVADDGTHGSQLWVTDGTASGTQMLTTVNDTASGGSSVASGAYPSSLTVLGGKLYFIADTPSSSTNDESAQGLWVSDGTPGGTAELATAPTLAFAGSSATGELSDLTAVGPKLFFDVTFNTYSEASDRDVTEAQLWTSDGTVTNTVVVPAPASGSPFKNLSNFNVVDGELLFQAVDSSGDTGLWTSNGTKTGTTLLKVLSDTSNGGYYYDNYNYSGGGSLVANGVLYFDSNDGTHGDELWQSDGTAAGTYLVDDINPGAASSNPKPLAALNGQLVLAADNGTDGDELMKLVPISQTASPGVISIPTQQITAGQTLTLDVSTFAYDANSPTLPLSYSLGTNAPVGASINPATGVFTWATAVDQATGSTSFTVTVSDNSSPSLTATETFSVNVDPVSSPSFESIPEQTIGGGHTFNFDVSQFAFDPNYPAFPLTYAVGSAPTGATINASTGMVTWATTASEDGDDESFTVTASDNSTPALTASETFTVSVETVDSPTVLSIPTQGVNIGQTLTLALNTYASDPNYPALPLTYALGADAPAGASINSTTGLLTFTPGSNQATGPVSIPFVVSDNSTPALTATGTVTVDVGTAGTVRPPVLTLPASAPTVILGSTLNFDVGSYASDPNSPALTLTYSLGLGAPSGATINATTGEITWATSSTQPLAAYSFPVTVTDSSTPALTASETYIADVVGSYFTEPPTLSSLPSQEVDIGSTLQFNVATYASDPNTPRLPLTYSLGTGAPAGASINPTTGLLTWTPPSNQATGSITFPVTVSDYLTPPNTATQNLTIQVFAAGTAFAPTVGSVPVQHAVAGQQLELDFSQYVSNPSQLTLSYSVDSTFFSPSGTSIDSTTGLFTWTPASDQVGDYEISITVSNSQTASVVGSFNVDVTQYALPILQPIAAQTAIIGQPFSLALSNYASDPNASPPPLTYSLGGYDVPSGASVNTSTGLLIWTPTMFEDESYSVILTVTESEAANLTASETFTLRGAEAPPTFGSIPNQTATIGQELQFDVGQYVSDSADSYLSYTLGSGAPAGAAVSGGEFTWTPAPGQSTGMTTITVNVSDNESPPQTATATFDVNVLPAPIEPPVVAGIPAQTAGVGNSFSLDVSQYASDPNTPALTLSYSLGAGSPSGASINATSGVITWTPGSTQTSGVYPFTVDVTDNASPTQTTIAGFSVLLTMTSPLQFTPIPSQSATVATTFNLNISQYVSDSNTAALPLSYQLSGAAPNGASIDPSTGLLTWNVPANQPTTSVSFTVTVSDSSTPALTASQPITIDVFSKAVNPPKFSAIPAATATAGQAFTFNASAYASDPNTPALTLSYKLGAGAPTGASINATTGVLSWTPPSNQATGPVSITIIALDSNSPPLMASATLTVNVSASSSSGGQSPTPTPTPTLTTKVLISEQPVFERKLNKKGKPTGKPVLSGFTLQFGVALNAASASNAANYQLDTVTTKKVKKKSQTILHPITNFSVSYVAASDSVDFTFGGNETFPTGGQLTVLNGVTTAAGGTLTGNAVYTISKGGKSVSLSS